MNNPRNGKPDRVGKNVWRPRETDSWYYKFEVNRQLFHGPCGTIDKGKAAALAARLKLEAKYRVKHAGSRAQRAAQTHIATGKPFVLLLASGEYISNIDRRDIAALLRVQLARLEGLGDPE